MERQTHTHTHTHCLSSSWALLTSSVKRLFFLIGQSVNFPKIRWGHQISYGGSWDWPRPLDLFCLLYLAVATFHILSYCKRRQLQISTQVYVPRKLHTHRASTGVDLFEQNLLLQGDHICIHYSQFMHSQLSHQFFRNVASPVYSRYLVDFWLCAFVLWCLLPLYLSGPRLTQLRSTLPWPTAGSSGTHQPPEPSHLYCFWAACTFSDPRLSA